MKTISKSQKKISKKPTFKYYDKNLRSLTPYQIYQDIENRKKIKDRANTYITNALINPTTNEKDHQRFLLNASVLSSQQYGPALQKYHLKLWNVDASLNNGDGISQNGNLIEFKASYIKESNDKFNLVQIRLNDNIDYFVCLLIDVTNYRNLKYDFVILNRQQMTKEVKQIGNFAHGNKAKNLNNSNPEYRISLNNVETERWIKNYGNHSLRSIRKFL